MTPAVSPPPFQTVTDGTLRLRFHPGQSRAWRSERRFVCVIAGHQSGKTVLGPLWLRREIERRGPGDYLVVSPTNPLLIKKALPAFCNLFEHLLALGRYKAQRKTFEFSRSGHRRTFGEAVPYEPTTVFFGHATDPESLESATAKAAWLDEAGQNKFKLDSWEAVQRRLSIHQGRVLITTTPYNLGWLKTQVHDPWVAAKRAHPEIEVVGFDSTANPAFPREEYERKFRELPAWKFSLFYRGIFERPAGVIYESFDVKRHVVPRFTLPAHWRRFVGVDFGPTNTAAVFFAEEQDERGKPTRRLIAYREYHPGKRDPKEHAAAIRQGEPRTPFCVGGSATEEEWRQVYGRNGLPLLAPPIGGVEEGIEIVYACHARDEIVVFDDLVKYLDQKATYSRETDESGDVLEKIEDKQLYHLLDAERYVISYLRHGRRLTVGV